MQAWLIYSILSALMAALVAIFGKLGLKNIDSTLATTIRSIVMALFLIITSFVLKKFDGFSFHSMILKDWLLIILAGIAGATSWLFYFLALKSGDTTKVVAIDRLSLVFVAILAFLFLGETLSWQEMIGVAMMVGGAIIVSIF
jgi:transporter family protein